MSETAGKKVFVGLSGGVDSSVAALRLIEAGYEVYGVFIKVWHPDWMVCNWEQERLDAMRVAAKLKIPFLTCDAVAEYEHEVATYFIAEYTKGRTPNPDVMCNKAVKFGAFLRFAKKHGADFIATGHYAERKVSKVNEREVFELYRGKDSEKDQSYFLWTLTQEQLSCALFPVGDTPKQSIRAEADKAGLITAEKKDSQGICFLGHVDIPEFLSHYTTLTPGQLLNENGDVVGEHRGALVYTKGQRHGFTYTASSTGTKAHYVVDRDIENNTVTVSDTPPHEHKGESITLESVNYIGLELTTGQRLEIQTRYRQTPTRATVTEKNGHLLTLLLDEQTESISEGQSCVLYDGERCLGGGIISAIAHGSKST